MPRPTVLLVALVLGALSALAVACGEEREGLIASSRASTMQELLDNVDQYTSEGRCAALEKNLDALRREVEQIPGSTDRELRRRLRQGAQNLERQAPEECEDNEEPETTPETTPDTVPTAPPETTAPETTSPETTPPETAPPETTPPETTPPQTTPPQTTPPEELPDSGGEEAPLGGVGNGNGKGNGKARGAGRGNR